jgi:hypothetical protein
MTHLFCQAIGVYNHHHFRLLLLHIFEFYYFNHLLLIW